MHKSNYGVPSHTVVPSHINRPGRALQAAKRWSWIKILPRPSGIPERQSCRWTRTPRCWLAAGPSLARRTSQVRVLDGVLHFGALQTASKLLGGQQGLRIDIGHIGASLRYRAMRCGLDRAGQRGPAAQPFGRRQARQKLHHPCTRICTSASPSLSLSLSQGFTSTSMCNTFVVGRLPLTPFTPGPWLPWMSRRFCGRADPNGHSTRGGSRSVPLPSFPIALMVPSPLPVSTLL